MLILDLNRRECLTIARIADGSGAALASANRPGRAYSAYGNGHSRKISSVDTPLLERFLPRCAFLN